MDENRIEEILQSVAQNVDLRHYIYDEEYHMFNSTNFPYTDVGREEERKEITAFLRSNGVKFEVREDDTIHIFLH